MLVPWLAEQALSAFVRVVVENLATIPGVPLPKLEVRVEYVKSLILAGTFTSLMPSSFIVKVLLAWL